MTVDALNIHIIGIWLYFHFKIKINSSKTTESTDTTNIIFIDTYLIIHSVELSIHMFMEVPTRTWTVYSSSSTIKNITSI